MITNMTVLDLSCKWNLMNEPFYVLLLLLNPHLSIIILLWVSIVEPFLKKTFHLILSKCEPLCLHYKSITCTLKHGFVFSDRPSPRLRILLCADVFEQLCCCLVAKSCPTLLWPHGLQVARLLCPWNFPDKNTGVGSYFLFQGFFPTHGLNLHFLHWQVSSLPLGVL